MALLAAALILGISTVSSAAPIPGFSAVPLSAPAEAFPGAQARGPDNEIFYSDFGGKIGRIAFDGNVTETAVPAQDGQPWSPSGLVFGPDGALWFLVTRGEGDGETRMARWRAPGPDFTTFPLPTPGGGGGPMIVGPDGKLWYSQPRASKIGRVDLFGSVAETSLAVDSWPNDLASGPDGNVWVALEQSGSIARIQPNGAVTEFPVPPPPGVAPQPARIIAGPDSQLAFSDPVSNSVWRITTDGVFSRYTIPTASSEPYGLAAASTGPFVYFTERTPDAIGRLDVRSGDIAESPMPGAATRQFPHEITLAFPLPFPQPVDTFIVNSPQLFRATAAAPALHGPALDFSLTLASGGETGHPEPGTPFEFVASVFNRGDMGSARDLVVSFSLPDTVEVVSAAGCTGAGESTLICPAGASIPPGARKDFSCTLRLRDGAPATVTMNAYMFGGDATGPRATVSRFGRPVTPVTPPVAEPVIGRRQ